MENDGYGACNMFSFVFISCDEGKKMHPARASNQGPAVSQTDDQHTRPLGQPVNHIRWQIIGPYMY